MNSDFRVNPTDESKPQIPIMKPLHSSLPLAMFAAAVTSLTSTSLVHAATLTHVSDIQISSGSNFNISVYDGKAGYSGVNSGSFGDGTVEAYYFIKNETAATTAGGADGTVGTPVRYADDGSTILSTVTNSGGTGFAEFNRGDVWTTNDPGTNFSGGAAANFGGDTETISGALATTGTINISGFASGTIYFLAGGFTNSGQTTGFDLTMTGAGQGDVTAGNSFVPNATRNMYVQSFTFSDAADYSEISYTHFGTAGNRSRMMGVIVDGVAIPEPSTALLGGLGFLMLLRRRR
jgi:hypothetical protein